MKSKANQKCIVLAGAAHVDRTGRLDASSETGCSNPGRFEEYPGGTAFNIAVVVASLGIKPKVITQLGDDSAAQWLRSAAKENDITLIAEETKSANTGTYTAIIEPDGSLLIGMADMAVYDQFNASGYTDKLQGLASDDWFCVDTNLPPKEIAHLLRSTGANRVGLTVSKAKAPKLRHVINSLDLLFTNRVEAHALCGLVEDTKADQHINGLLQLGVKNAVISNGSADVTVVQDGNIMALPVPKVRQVIDVTGAGDALVGGALSKLLHNTPLPEAVEFGIRAAQRTIEIPGPWAVDLAAVQNGRSGHPSKTEKNI